jgi:MFS transporter, ACS family, hexuronate transporter
VNPRTAELGPRTVDATQAAIDPAAGVAPAGAVATDSGSILAYAPVTRIGRYRWVICGLLFFATTINYLDRMVLGILAPQLQEELGWSETHYGYVSAAFTFSYAIGLLVVGGLIDRWGTRRGFSLAVLFWSLAAMAHGLAHTWWGFAAARAALALGEAGNFPAAVRTVAEWFPKRERALATGVFNAGSNAGALIAPLAVPFIVLHLGWRWAFLAMGATGLVWLLFWLAMYRRPQEHPRVAAQELSLIQSDPPEPDTHIPWRRLVPHRQAWAFALGKFLTDPVWWFFLFWLPKFLDSTHGLTLSGLALPLVITYLAADVGSIGGGWLSSRLIRSGWSVNAARKTAVLACAACVTPMILAPHVRELWMTVGLISLAAAAHQGWSCNLFTLVSDTFPRRAVGRVVGLGGMAGALAGALASIGIGKVLDFTGQNYVPLLTMTGLAYLFTLILIHVLVPRLDAAPID